MNEILLIIIKILVIFLAIFTFAAYYTLAERKLAGYFQRRLGPNRSGPFGLLQPLSDGLKFFFKEEMLPTNAYKWLYLVAPVISLTPALLVYVVIPFGGYITVPEIGVIEMAIAPDIHIGLVYILAIASLSVYGLIIAGWASNNKYALMGTLGAAAQTISYELSLGLAIIGVVMCTESFYLFDIVKEQYHGYWFVWRQPIAFLIFIVAMFAETNRTPFDLAEAESELVVGFHTEYGSVKWMVFFVAEYINMITMSSLAALIFLGGWDLFGFQLSNDILQGILNIAVFTVKAGFFAFFFIWVRWTLPRFRYDQLMRLGWKVLLPLGLLNVFITGIVQLYY
jgi:NADH-quinone oxidoreductase subunit H